MKVQQSMYFVCISKIINFAKCIHFIYTDHSDHFVKFPFMLYTPEMLSGALVR